LVENFPDFMPPPIPDQYEDSLHFCAVTAQKIARRTTQKTIIPGRTAKKPEPLPRWRLFTGIIDLRVWLLIVAACSPVFRLS
jgi:hypothetical protein